VNRVIWHGYASKWGPRQSVRWPGYEAGLGSINGKWGSRNPSYQDYEEYNDHLGRLQTVLRAGVPQVDLAILYSDYAYQLPKRNFAPDDPIGDLRQQQHRGWQWEDLTLQDAGYTYDYFAPQYLDGGHAEYDARSGLLAADGPAYQALLVYQEQIPIRSAQELLAMARRGLKVVVVEGAMERTTFNDGKDAELSKVRRKLLALRNVELVEDQQAAYDALRGLGVQPRVGYGTPDEELLSVTRKDSDASYLFLYNYYNVLRGWDDGFTTFDKAASWDPESARNTIEVEGRPKPYLMDTWTGEVTEVATYHHRTGRTVVPVDIPDGDVRVYIFEKERKPDLRVTATDAPEVLLDDGTVTVRSTSSGEHFVELSDGRRRTISSTVPGSRSLTGWDVDVESWTPGELSAPRSETTRVGNFTEEYAFLTQKTDIPLRLDELATWDDLEQVGRDVSGVGTYRTTFDWDASAASGAYLDLGPIVESATVRVNGEETEDVNLVDAVVDIPGSLLRDGENTLEIVVTTPLANTALAIGWNGANLTEGPFFDNQSQRRLLDHVYTYFDHGLPQAVLTPYVDTVVTP
jgi:hypothetical protein